MTRPGRHPKVIVTPHLASLASRPARARYVADAIAAYERGETPPNLYDPAPRLLNGACLTAMPPRGATMPALVPGDSSHERRDPARIALPASRRRNGRSAWTSRRCTASSRISA